MAEFGVEEILKATKGELAGGSAGRRFSGVSTDSRTIKKGELFVAIKGERFDGHDFIADAIKRGASGLLVHDCHRPSTMDYGLWTIRVPDTAKAFGDIAASHRKKFKISIIAVTGSNGKTTAKEMIAAILGQRFRVLKSEGTENNNIGVSKTILRLHRDFDAAVVELGTNHFGEIRRLAQILSPTIGVITNVGPSHLEFLEDLDGVFREKRTLFDSFGAGDTAIVNGDDERLAGIKARKYKVIKFGTKSNSDFRAANVTFSAKILGGPASGGSKDGFGFILNGRHKFRVNLLGRHNLSNAIAAIGAARVLGVPYGEIGSALSDFEGPKMRMEDARLSGIRIINDAYNSNPLSLREAISWLGEQKIAGRKFLVTADMLELGRDAARCHMEAGEFAAKQKIDYLICVGPRSRMVLEGALSAGANRQKTAWFDSAERIGDAALLLKKLAARGDLVLVKGSRAMRMEEFVRCFTAFFIR